MRCLGQLASRRGGVVVVRQDPLGRCGGRGGVGPVRNRRGRGLKLAQASKTVFEWEAEQDDGSQDPGEMVKGLANKVQTQAPLLGLLTKLMSPQGIKGQLTYQEFSRAIYDNVPTSFHIACENTEKRHGEMAGIRGCMYCLWMSCFGTGVVKEDDMLEACTKLRLNSDLEYFIELFEFKRDEGLKRQFQLAEKPRITQEQKISLAIKNLFNLMNLAELDKETQNDFFEIVSACFPSTDPTLVRGLIEKHPKAV